MSAPAAAVTWRLDSASRAGCLSCAAEVRRARPRSSAGTSCCSGKLATGFVAPPPGSAARQGRALYDLAIHAADDALVAVLAKLEQFRGDARFTTWARLFATLEAPGEIRRRRGHTRELPTDAENWAPRQAASEDPEQRAGPASWSDGREPDRPRADPPPAPGADRNGAELDARQNARRAASLHAAGPLHGAPRHSPQAARRADPGLPNRDDVVPAEASRQLKMAA